LKGKDKERIERLENHIRELKEEVDVLKGQIK
jgi:hypothetical protein